CESGSALYVSQTGALSGHDDDAEAFFRSCGFPRVDTIEGLIEAPMLTGAFRPAAGLGESRVAVISSTGGGAALVVDQLALRGVSIGRPSAAVFERLAASDIDGQEGLIVDLNLAGSGQDKLKRALSILQESGEFDLVVFVAASSARSNPELAVHALTECTEGPTPLTVFVLPEAPDSLAMLARAGISAFRTPESCADAIAARYRASDCTLNPIVRTREVLTAPRVLDEAESGDRLRVENVPLVPSVVHAASEVHDLDEAEFPFVVKALSDRLPHKSEAGAVRLGIMSNAELAEA